MIACCGCAPQRRAVTGLAGEYKGICYDEHWCKMQSAAVTAALASCCARCLSLSAPTRARNQHWSSSHTLLQMAHTNLHVVPYAVCTLLPPNRSLMGLRVSHTFLCACCWLAPLPMIRMHHTPCMQGSCAVKPSSFVCARALMQQALASVRACVAPWRLIALLLPALAGASQHMHPQDLHTTGALAGSRTGEALMCMYWQQ